MYRCGCPGRSRSSSPGCSRWWERQSREMSGMRSCYHHRCHCLLETGRKSEVSFLRRLWPELGGGVGLGMLPSGRCASVGGYEDIHHCGCPRLYYRPVRRQSSDVDGSWLGLTQRNQLQLWLLCLHPLKVGPAIQLPCDRGRYRSWI